MCEKQKKAKTENQNTNKAKKKKSSRNVYGPVALSDKTKQNWTEAEPNNRKLYII